MTNGFNPPRASDHDEDDDSDLADELLVGFEEGVSYLQYCLFLSPVFITYIDLRLNPRREL